jgi:hypothetical protein
MRGFFIPGLFAAGVIAMAAWLGHANQCSVLSPKGPAIGGAILLYGCP